MFFPLKETDTNVLIIKADATGIESCPISVSEIFSKVILGNR